MSSHPLKLSSSASNHSPTDPFDAMYQSVTFTAGHFGTRSYHDQPNAGLSGRDRGVSGVTAEMDSETQTQRMKQRQTDTDRQTRWRAARHVETGDRTQRVMKLTIDSGVQASTHCS